MLTELWLMGIVGSAVGYLTQDLRQNSRIKKEITRKWNLLMESHKSNGENGLKQSYELLDVVIKEYGFNAIVSMPIGTNITALRKLLPSIEIAYGGDAILELSSEKTSAYLRVALKDLPISDKDLIRFKWYKTFFKSADCRNDYGQTFNIKNMIEIYNPSLDKEDEKSLVGYKITVDFPVGLSYEDLSKYEEKISNSIGRCFMEWNHKNREAIVEIIMNPLTNTTRFKPVKCEPWQLYVALRYNYEPILLDFKTSPNLLTGGTTGTGKTVCIISAFINLCLNHNKDKFRLIIGLISEKQDFRIFKNLEHCDYYAKTLEDSLKAVKYLVKEVRRRNNLFEKCKKFTTNLYEYNKQVRNKLPIIYFATDEISNYSPISTDDDSVVKQKQAFMDNFWKLAREGRSAGIYISVATQRGDLKNLDGNVKGCLSNKISFKQTNTASALTIFGSGDKVATKVTKLDMEERECLIEYKAGQVIAKTLHLDVDMMESLVSGLVVENKQHLILDDEGRVLDKELDSEAIDLQGIIEIIKPKKKKVKKARYLEIAGGDK